MRKVIYISFLYTFICVLVSCKEDVSLDKENNVSLNIAESKEKKVFINEYYFTQEKKSNTIDIIEVWSEKKWFCDDNKLFIDEQSNFNISLKFKDSKNNFSNCQVYFSQNDYFERSAYISNIYKSVIKKSFQNNGNLDLSLVAGNDTIPLKFIKK